MSKKAGETLIVSVQQLDANGEQLSETTHEVNGLDNATANGIYASIIDGMEKLFGDLGAAKNAGSNNSGVISNR